MNKELLIELASAGYIFRRWNGENVEVFTFPMNGAHNWLVPTLEELIEACGENFAGLHEDGDGYSAFHMLTHDGRFDPDIAISGHGKTPKEAVARLWLALNRK